MSASRTITPDEFKDKLPKNSLVLDVRERFEVAAESLPGAKNIPLSELDRHAGALDKGAPVFLLCRSGSRAAQAAEKLSRLGFSEVTVIEGGLAACKKCGMEITTGKSSVWALERQVRTAAGLLVLTGVLLGLWVHPAWIGLSAFVGAGLLFSGISNTCGMALLLARMPWNRNGGK